MQNHSITDKQILEAFDKHEHIGKMAAELKIPAVSVWRRSKKLKLKFSGIGQGKKLPLEEILQGLHPHFQTFKLKQKMLNAEVIDEKCGSCGLTEWLDQPIALQLDHIDGDSSNHLRDNLRLLCPNCHSQTNTYCGKNK